MIWLTISGGVRIADIMNARSMANFLFLLNPATVTSPSLDKKNTMTGTSNTIPKAIRSLKERERYSFTEGRAVICSLA